MTTPATKPPDHPHVVTGLFRDRESAERAYQSITERGYQKSDVTVVMSDAARNRYFSIDSEIPTELSEKAAEKNPSTAKALGGPVGGTVGILAPVLAAAAVLALPGLGLVVAGPIAAAFAAAGAVGLAGGLVGALTDWGLSKERIHQYETGIRDGGILMGLKARTKEDAAYFEQHWKVSGGEYVHS